MCVAALLGAAPPPSFALELGEATVQSSLGQSLVVHIPYRVAAGESLAPTCVGLAPTRGGDALPTYTQASRVAITPTHIEIVGDARVVEPLIGLAVDVHCATAPRFAREYQLFVDPPGRIPAAPIDDRGARTASTLPSRSLRDAPAAPPPTAVAPSATAPSSVAPTRLAEGPAPRARGQEGGALARGQTYVVVRGDTLSGIAARVADRQGTIRETAAAIFAANPQAFARGNPDLIEAGRSIEIPRMTAVVAQPTGADVVTSVEPAPRALTPEATTAEAVAPQVVAPQASAPQGVTPQALVAPIATQTQPAALETRVVAPAQIPAATAPVVDTAATAEPVVAPPQAMLTAPTAPTSPAATSIWSTVLLMLGAGALGATAATLVMRRRRRDEEAADRPVAPRSAQPRALVDAAAGIDVVEGRLGRTPAREAVAMHIAEAPPAHTARATVPAAAALDIDLSGTVDLDIGEPVDRTPRLASETAETAVFAFDGSATARMPEPPSRVAAPPPAELEATSHEETVDDPEHTLTIVELDMLREDYEAEHTLTQESSKTLREALADLKATRTAREAAEQTATLEMPPPGSAKSRA